jgi:hypothetical protein
MKIKKECIERFVTMLAFMDEVYPDPRPWARAQWAAIRKKHEMDCLKYGKCEICGEEDLLGEWGLTWVCDKPACLKEVKEGYDEILADWHKKSH